MLLVVVRMMVVVAMVVMVVVVTEVVEVVMVVVVVVVRSRPSDSHMANMPLSGALFKSRRNRTLSLTQFAKAKNQT